MNDLEFIGTTMPTSWLWGKEESQVINNVKAQIENKWPQDRNLLINLTWVGPGFNNGYWQQILDIVKNKEKFDRVVMLSSVDPLFITPDHVEWINQNLSATQIIWAGNYQSKHEFNFFAIVGKRLFHCYSDQEVLMTQPDYLFLNYNRKPRQHRVDFIKKLLESGLSSYGVFTLGNDNSNTYSQNNNLFFTIGEKQEDYKNCMHQSQDSFGIPDDVLSLHNMDIWRRHFLNIIGATEFWPWDPIFVTESQWKPIIGLRPFVINGNIGTYKWLESHGFRTFNKYFPVNLEVHESQVHDSIIDLLNWLKTQNLQQLYQEMLPDLLHNKNRFYEFADEQEYKLYHLFDKD